MSRRQPGQQARSNHGGYRPVRRASRPTSTAEFRMKCFTLFTQRLRLEVGTDAIGT
ncbi:hypothetical protein FOQG_04895 [Fusarium oxysporum f. sp. raphani 54005]|uniref:Uncharacterized protein n=5 Tax=Fusarium oxysporum TaxID=5507 RepID=W9HDY7_FUSOX|nr:hypothetical protein FOYG_16405 [Fusarium oxysporum NRRL 32931]EXA54391.1 hypothetical protein FOVG_01858 [Fusarium oxysporum f. sp. pisi HDV247]EXK93648.1 hypothetical protein FOQG_04895 [Fusarium oxysporum f. sp. raphani 54005]EXL87836.1 hypothetical protein FOPG_01422 [Fusarium oxysporum f. sp. conglutinans race 2 54008]EXM29110.1 hypothetical protein FOTG_05338 [Fusarium oxysporum f. sp. vasinfectum 25433]